MLKKAKGNADGIYINGNKLHGKTVGPGITALIERTWLNTYVVEGKTKAWDMREVKERKCAKLIRKAYPSGYQEREHLNADDSRISP